MSSGRERLAAPTWFGQEIKPRTSTSEQKCNETPKIKRGRSERTLSLHFISISSESGQTAVALSDGWREPLCSLPRLSESPVQTERIDENRSISPPFQGPAKCSFCLRLLSRGAERADCQGAHLGPSFGKRGGLNFQNAATSLALTSCAIINHIADELVNVYCTIGTFVTKQHLC